MRTSIHQNCKTCAYGAHDGVVCTYIPPPVVRNFIRYCLGTDVQGIKKEFELSQTEPDQYCTEWRSKAEFRDPVEELEHQP